MNIKNRDFRFLLVGTTTALIYFLLMWLLMTFNIRPAISATVAFLIAFACAYSAQRKWTFASKVGHSTLLPRYLISQILCVTTSAGIAEIAHKILLFPDSVVVAALATFVSGGMSYLLSSRWVFAKSAQDLPYTEQAPHDYQANQK